MPTYVYRREDGSTFEVEQRITEDPLEACPTTGQPVARVISGGTGLIFKGSGFYLTDYVRNNGSQAGGSETKTSSNGDATDKATPKDASAKETGKPGKTDAKTD